MRNFAAFCLLLLTLFGPTQGGATPGQDIVTASLMAQGYEVQLVHWTLLGRIRIVAVNATIRREIVINPNTGEILRDYAQPLVTDDVADNNHDSGDHSETAAARQAEPTDVDASAVSALGTLSVEMAPSFADTTDNN